jgi:class 3 adenylate cyclase/ligand-binding sensor domain-containing protein/predicted metal-dependent HD superfamily phosphohydrolase
MNKRLSTFVILIAIASNVLSQVSYRFNNFTIRDGLSQSTITSIIQDRIGTLWIGTQDGLNRFDGQQFDVYTADNTKGLSSSYIYSSAKLHNGNLCFGTSDGLVLFSAITETFSSILSEEENNIAVESITEMSDGTIWFGSTKYGLTSYNPASKKIGYNYGNKQSNRIHYLKDVSESKLLVSFEDKGLFTYNVNQKTWKKIQPNTGSKAWVISDAERYTKNTYILSSNHGLWLYNAENDVLEPFLPNLITDYQISEFSDVYVRSLHEIFIATNNSGLIYANLYQGAYRFQFNKKDVFQKNCILSNETSKLFADKDGAIWVGTQLGISGFNPKHDGFFGVGTRSDLNLGLPSESVWGFAESSNSEEVYVATDFAISVFNHKTGLFNHYSIPKDKTIVSFHVVNAHEILLGTSEFLYRLTILNNKTKLEKIPYKGLTNPTSFQRIYTIQPYKGIFLIGTKGGVLQYSPKTGVFKEIVDQHHKSIGICRTIYQTPENTYFSSGLGGIFSLVKGVDTLVLSQNPYNEAILKASRYLITCFYQETKNTLWMGTAGSGLLRLNLKNGTVRTFSRKQGLPNNYIYGILPDKRGNIWLSTNRGLSRFNLVNEQSVNYSELSGLMSDEFNTGAYLLSKTGTMYFGGIQGYNFFNPEKYQRENEKLQLAFYKFRFDDNWLLPSDKQAPFKQVLSTINTLHLNYNQRSFTIRFLPSALLDRESLQFKYELVGLNEGEVMLGSNSEIHFTSLASGEYQLRVFVRKQDGEWSNPYASMSITIDAPFWGTWWFWTIIAFVFIIFILIFIRWRINIARKEQIYLEMKIVERTKEIRAQNRMIEAQKRELEDEKNKVEEQRRLLQIEKDKTESVLRNVMPESTAEELKSKGRASARAYKTVSVLFTDFVGFTKIAEGLSPMELVNKLDVYFRKFDEIIVRNNLEKIKTIGDAYMCAGGVPVRNNTNPIDAVLAALQIQDYMNKLKHEALANETEYWELRLGINTGEVTAGVIGSERLAYDIWGATVNHAQRMENMGEVGKVTISGSTFKLVEPYFECTYRGKVKTKSKGLIEMFTVERIKPELSENGEGLVPNDRFQQIVNLHLYSSINYYKAERHIIKVLEKGLSPALHYHSIEHTKDVVRAVERFALLEGVTDEGLFLLKSAATYHDAGFVEQYEKNEPIGARMADEILPKYGYSEQHIQRIKELIFVTQIPHQPKDKLEEIICDADLDYLGRDDFHEIADRLRLELREHGKINSDRQWDEMQVSFLTMHKYFTPTAIASRQAKKMQNLAEIKERLLRDEYKD